jgi:hypothetical protein
MSKKTKLFAKVKNNQKNVRFEDFCTLMTYFAFILVRVRGGHHLYQNIDIDALMNVQPTSDNLAKAYQVRQFLKLIEEHKLKLLEEEDKDDAK